MCGGPDRFTQRPQETFAEDLPQRREICRFLLGSKTLTRFEAEVTDVRKVEKRVGSDSEKVRAGLMETRPGKNLSVTDGNPHPWQRTHKQL